MKIEVEKVSKVLEGYLNRFGHPEKDLVKEIEIWHPTLQQSFTRLCVSWFLRMAENDFRYDGRNEASVKLARELYPTLKKAYLPLV